MMTATREQALTLARERLKEGKPLSPRLLALDLEELDLAKRAREGTLGPREVSP